MNGYTTLMQVAPVTLEGNLVRLEPLSMDHFSALAEIAFNAEMWRWMSDPMKTEDDLRRYIQAGVDAAAAGAAMPWATRSKKDNRIVGSTRFADIQPSHRTLEIGWTWMLPDYQRSGINVEAKYLQLRHAFEVMGSRRVAFKTHHHNLKSQNAIQALGAKHEGIFRNHVIMPDGTARHSYWYSIIDEEWPEVKANLEKRMQRHLELHRPKPLPLNLPEKTAQTRTLLGMNHFHKADASFQVRSKRRMLLAVLALGAKTNAVRQNRIQQIEITAHNIHFFVGDKPRQVLPPSAAHDASLAMMDAESFLQQNSCYMFRKPLRIPAESLVSGKREIVGVARVLRTR